MLDYRLDVAKFKWGTLRVGQWKIDYNRERVDSSGAQTVCGAIDRQCGRYTLIDKSECKVGWASL